METTRHQPSQSQSSMNTHNPRSAARPCELCPRFRIRGARTVARVDGLLLPRIPPSNRHESVATPCIPAGLGALPFPVTVSSFHASSQRRARPGCGLCADHRSSPLRLQLALDPRAPPLSFRPALELVAFSSTTHPLVFATVREDTLRELAHVYGDNDEPHRRSSHPGHAICLPSSRYRRDHSQASRHRGTRQPSLSLTKCERRLGRPSSEHPHPGGRQTTGAFIDVAGRCLH